MKPLYIAGHRQGLQLSGKERVLTDLVSNAPRDIAEATTLWVAGAAAVDFAPVRVAQASCRYRDYVRTEAAVARAIARQPRGVLLLPYGTQSLAVPRTSHRKVVIAHDMFFKMRSAETRTAFAGAAYRKLSFRLAISGAAMILASNDALARELESAAPVATVRWGVDTERFNPSAEYPGLETDSYLLMFGGTSKRKNVSAQVNACSAAAGRRGLGLAVIGHIDHESLQIGRAILKDRLVHFRVAEDAILPGLIRGAACAVVCPAEEGYGLPALEALATGTRVVATNMPSLADLHAPQLTIAGMTEEEIASGIDSALLTARSLRISDDLLSRLDNRECSRSVWARISAIMR